MYLYKFLYVIFFLFCINSAYAEQIKGNLSSIEKRQLIKITTKYINSVACNNSEIRNEDVITLVPHTNDNDLFEAKYGVIWTGEIGCEGTAGYGPNIAIVRIGRDNSYHVSPIESSPSIEFEAPVHYVTKLVNYTSTSIEFDGLEKGESDPNCCPSINVRFTLRLDNQGNWKLANQNYL